MKRSTVLAIALAFLSVVASLLVLYFDWRGKLQHRIVAERDERPDREKAA